MTNTSQGTSRQPDLVRAMQDGRCLFCSIADKQTPAFIVWENDRLLAFLDINPIRPGHIQIIPREHFPYFDELPDDLAGEMTRVGQRLARVLKNLYRVRRVGFAFTGNDIEHAHAHVVPLVEPTDITSRRYIAEEHITFRNPPSMSHGEMAATAETIRETLRDGFG